MEAPAAVTSPFRTPSWAERMWELHIPLFTTTPFNHSLCNSWIQGAVTPHWFWTGLGVIKHANCQGLWYGIEQEGESSRLILLGTKPTNWLISREPCVALRPHTQPRWRHPVTGFFSLLLWNRNAHDVLSILRPPFLFTLMQVSCPVIQQHQPPSASEKRRMLLRNDSWHVSSHGTWQLPVKTMYSKKNGSAI